jgi:hypothetical protein
VKQDGKNEGLFWRFFRLLKSELESLLMIFLPTLRQSRGLIKMSIDFMITGATTKAIQKTISLGAVGCIRIVIRPPKYKKSRSFLVCMENQSGFLPVVFYTVCLVKNME